MAPKNVSRRDFFRTTAAVATAGALAAPGIVRAGQLPSGRLRIGLLGAGARGQTHLDTLLALQATHNLEVVAVCDVYTKHREKAVDKLQAKQPGRPILSTPEYRDVLTMKDLDAVCIATPDHWHAQMTIDALAAGKHVYIEKPMTHTPAEAQAVVAAWRSSVCVAQVGVQRTSDGRWNAAREFILAGRVGKVLHGQTEYFRNSATGQWRYIGLSRDMTPQQIDWPRFLGTEFQLAPAMPFDRALFAQWRCYWPFGSGLFGELFVPRLTELLLATGLREPRRVTAGGGIFLEYDGRDVPDTATLIADYAEGCQLVVSSTLGNDHPVETCLRGHFGTLVFRGCRDGFEFLPQRPQVTRLRQVQPEQISAPRPTDETKAHWENFLSAIAQNAPDLCHNPPDLGAAAVITAQLGALAYRQGQVLEWDPSTGRVVPSSPAYAKHWEQRSHSQALPEQLPGWQLDPRHGSRQTLPDFQKLAGPWTDGRQDPAS